MKRIRRAGLFAFDVRPEQEGVLQGLAGLLARQGVRCTGLGKGAAGLRRAFPGLRAARSCRGLDAVLSLGGDGTLLGAVALAAPERTPVLGVNLGQLGYMTAVSSADLARALPPLLAGLGRLERRAMLAIEVWRRGRLLQRLAALNEAVLAGSRRGKLSGIEASIDSRPLAKFRADGLIVATPTGSTAYALAAGGPILVPPTDALLLAPIAPHTLSNRPLVVPGSSRLELRQTLGGGGLSLSADGATALDLRSGDSVRLRRSPRPALLVLPAGHDPWAVLRAKLGWQQPTHADA